MLESALARLLHHHLGKYILDFDADNLNVGVFSGDIRLTDLTLKPEALFELDLPIAVNYGRIESILINIPWSFLKTKPVTVTIQGIWLIVEPCIQNGDPIREKRLIRAARQNLLAETNGEKLLSQFFSAIQFNLQISINDIHIRYEDNTSKAACGLCIQSISLQTTDRKWKQLVDCPNSNNTFQILKIESLSSYWDTTWEGNGIDQDLYTIRNELANGLKTFTIYEKPYDFLLKPAMVKMKITIHRINDEDNHIQIDASLGDCVFQTSHAQIQSIQQVYSLLIRTEFLRRWIDIRPNVSIQESCSSWWKYAYKAVVKQRVKPYTWKHIKETRVAYKKYREIYIQTLKKPSDTELKLDLLKCEDALTLANIILAREEAKALLLQQNTEIASLPKPSTESLIQIEKPNHRFKLNLAIGNGSFNLYNGEQEVFSVHISQLAICAEPGSISFRLHTFLVEGLSNEDHLAPVISSSGYDTLVPIFALEIKRNLFERQYSVICNLESLEFIYNEFLISELFNFVNYNQIEQLSQKLKKLLDYSLPTGMDVNLCIKRPKFLFPETGCLQKGAGSMLIITPGLIQATREGTQDPDLEAGIAELEERLYTRWNILFYDAQILVVESGDAWREALDSVDSAMHFLHPCNGEILMLFNMFPIDKRLPLRKYNLSLNSLKITSSTNKVTMILDIIGNIPIPKPRKTKTTKIWPKWPLDEYDPQSELFELKRIKQSISSLVSNSTAEHTPNSTLEGSSSSEVSDLAEELWARTLDLPGFEDNISPSNQIQILLRISILESCISITRLNDGRNERSFLQLRMGKLCFESALLAYGPAIQLNVESILITEQFHMGPAGNYLELIASGPGQDILSVLYRKVRADCPDFRTYFRSVENSLVVDIGHLRLRWRSDACRAVHRYLRRLLDRIRNSKAFHRINNIWKRIKPTINDPPIPPGAVKFSKSLRISSLRLTIADPQTDVLELHSCGFEYDYMSKANEKVQFRIYLNALTIEDFTNLTLYPKILGMEEDYILELKYVGHSSHILQTIKNGVNLPCDGNLRFQLGRIHIAPLGARNLYKLLRPIPIQLYIQMYIQKFVKFILNNKLILSLQIGGPTLLIPQKLDSPNVVIIHKGDISVENFYTDTSNGIVNNILMKIDGTNISRAVMSLGGSLQLQGNLLEPLSIRLDIKQNINGYETMWSISGSTDTLRITLGQCDISTVLSISAEYLPKTYVVSDDDGRDHRMTELQAFLSQTVQKKIHSKFIIDGFYIELVSDCEEILSSPVRDMNRSLCRFFGNEINIILTINSDRSWKLISMFKDLTFVDTKASENSNENADKSGTVLSVELIRTNTLETNINLTINSFILKTSTLLITNLYQFFLECVPCEWPLEGGLENQGYETEVNNEIVSSKIKIKFSTFTFIIISQNKKMQLCFNADFHLFHSIESYMDIENVCLELQNDNDKEWIIEPFNAKLTYTVSPEKNKVSVMLSEIKINISSEIFHNCLKLWNELHIPMIDNDFKNRNFIDHDLHEDMWLPRKLSDDISNHNKRSINTHVHLFNENIIFIAPSITTVFNLENCLPVIVCRTTCHLELHEHCNIKLTIQSNYYNLQNNMWEPLIEPVGNDFRPYELNINIFKTTALPITTKPLQSDHKLVSRVTSSSIKTNVSDSSGDSDSDSGEIMSFMRPPPDRVLVSPSPPLGIGGDFESDGEDDILERITSTLSYLFTSDSSDEADSDSNASSDTELSAQQQLQENDQLVFDEIDSFNPINEVATYFVIDSKDRLELTVTPDSINIMNTIIKSLNNPHLTPKNKANNLNILTNHLGLDSLIELRDNNEQVICSTKQKENHESSTSSTETSPTHRHHPIFRKKSSLDIDSAIGFMKYTTNELYTRITKTKLRICIQNLSEISLTCPIRTCTKIIRLHPPLHGNVYYAVIDVNINGTNRTIVVHSPLQIRNETSYVLGLLYQADSLNNLNVSLQGEAINPFEGSMRIKLLQPHETYNVPLFIAYHCKLYIQPAHLDSSISDGILWSDINPPHIEECKMKLNDKNIFYIGVTIKSNVSLKEIPQSVPYKTICLLPPLIINNCLPRDLKITFSELEQYHLIEPSAHLTFYNVNPLTETKFTIEFEYYNLTWTSSITLGKELSNRVINMTCAESSSDKINLFVRTNWNSKLATCHIYIHSPYWILNRTDLDLQIKGCGADTVCTLHSDIPTLWTWPRGVRRKCIRLRIAQANWSVAFPLDTSGTTGRVVCRDRARGKQYRLLLNVNRAKATSFTTLVVLVPMFVVANHTDLKLRFMEENENADLWFDIAPGETVPFWPETNSMHMYLKLEDSRTVSQKFPITKQQYTVLRMGRLIPALMVSVFGGETSPFVISFCPYSTGQAPLLIVNKCYDLFLKFNQKGLCQTALLSPNHSLLYTWDDPSAERQLIWNIYNNKGRGFELQFNEDSDGNQTVENNKGEKVYVAWVCFMDNAQRTVVFAQNKKIFANYQYLEKAQLEIYLSMKGLGLSVCTKNNELGYYSISDRPAKWEVNVSRKWKELTADLATWIEEQYQWNRQKCQLRDYLEIDLEKMLLIKPFFGDLRRSYCPGLWIQFRQGIMKQYLHLEIQNMQIDNQLMLQSEHPPVILQFTDKNFPCIEIFNLWSLSNRAIYACNIQIRDLSILLDNNFLKQCHELWNELGPEHNQADRTRTDLKVLYSPIAPKERSNWQIYQMCFASFTIQLNICTGSEFLRSFFDVNRIQDKPVIFRIMSIDIKNVCKSIEKLVDTIYSHYVCNIMQQFYPLVIGQTVLLNPQEYSYDKVYIEIENLGAIGLSEAAKRLLGHIRGAELPHTATLFPLAEASYKSVRTSSDVTEAILVVYGLCGSQTTGEQIFRTSLRSLLGFSARDMFDSTSLILESIYRSQPNNVMRFRLPRVVDILYLEPFSWRRAIGQYLLSEISKLDKYWAHASFDANSKRLLIISFTYIYVIRKKQLWSEWEIEWKTPLDSIISIPIVENNNLVFTVTEEEADKFGNDKYRLAGDLTSLNWLKNKIEEVMILKIENEQWCG